MNTNALFEPIRATSQYKELFSKLEVLLSNGTHLPLLVNGLCDGSECALIYSLVKDIRAKSNQTVLIIIPEERKANRLNDFFKKCQLRCELYPMRDFNFYDMTASRELEQQRLQVLNGVALGTLDAVIATYFNIQCLRASFYLAHLVFL